MSYTLPPKYQRYADRLRELINLGNVFLKNLEKGHMGNVVRDEKSIEFHGWKASVENILQTVFGKESAHYSQYARLIKRSLIEYDYEISSLIGIIHGALDDLENGFLLNQEFLVASDVFASVLEQAKHLLSVGYKDPAAVLCRVVIEDSLKRLARANSLDATKKASVINQDLRQANIYNQPQWQQIDTWLTIGNKAAHGDFGAYNEDEVKRMIEGIEAFLASYLSIT